MKYFGTDGFRGEANVSLNVVHAYKVGRFLGNYYKKNSGKKEKIVIGKDTRCSGDMFESALCAGITASGTDELLILRQALILLMFPRKVIQQKFMIPRGI